MAQACVSASHSRPAPHFAGWPIKVSGAAASAPHCSVGREACKPSGVLLNRNVIGTLTSHDTNRHSCTIVRGLACGPPRGAGTVPAGDGLRGGHPGRLAYAAPAHPLVGRVDGGHPHPAERRQVAQGHHRLLHRHRRRRRLRGSRRRPLSPHERDRALNRSRCRRRARHAACSAQSALQRRAVHGSAGVPGSHDRAGEPARVGDRASVRGGRRRHHRPRRLPRRASGACPQPGDPCHRPHAAADGAASARPARQVYPAPGRGAAPAPAGQHRPGAGAAGNDLPGSQARAHGCVSQRSRTRPLWCAPCCGCATTL